MNLINILLVTYFFSKDEDGWGLIFLFVLIMRVLASGDVK